MEPNNHKYRHEKNFISSDWQPNGTKDSVDLTGSSVLFDGKRELIFVGGGVGQSHDVILGFENEYSSELSILGSLPKKVNDATTCSVACALFPDDSPQSMLVGRASGVYYYQDLISGWGDPVELWHRPESSHQIPSSISVADTDGNGLLDVYVSMYQRSDKFKPYRFSSVDTERSIFLKQISLGSFVDQSVEKGIAGERNTWSASFADLNGSGSPDLILSPDEGPPVIYWNNSGDFERDTTKLPVGYWMGLAIGDFLGTGYPSIFMSNVSNNVPITMMKFTGLDFNNPGAKGLTNDHLLIINDGKSLTPVSAAKDTGFGWGAVAIPGSPDRIAVAQNWPYLPWQKIASLRNPGMVGQLNSDGSIDRDTSYPNLNFGITPLVVDLKGNGDSYLVWINHKSPILAYRLKEKLPKREYVPRTAENSGMLIDGHLLTSGGTGLGSSESTNLKLNR